MKVSLDRIAEYLRGVCNGCGCAIDTDVHWQGELLSKSDTQDFLPQSTLSLPRKAPLLRDATFTWNKPDSGTVTPGRRRNFKLQIDGELRFQEGAVNLICGPTGCGKTSILMAILGVN